MNLDDILGMGRYGGYVWSCVVLTVVVLAGNVWLTRRALKAELIRARRRAAANQEPA
jgi:heme exporter protein CcmD